MIRVTLFQSGGKTLGFEAAGHADFAEAGKDIVCAGASVLLETTAHALRDVAKLQAGVSVGDDGVYCMLGTDTTDAQYEKAALLFDTMRYGLSALEKAYPGTLKIIDREV